MKNIKIYLCKYASAAGTGKAGGDNARPCTCKDNSGNHAV